MQSFRYTIHNASMNLARPQLGSYLTPEDMAKLQDDDEDEDHGGEGQRCQMLWRLVFGEEAKVIHITASCV